MLAPSGAFGLFVLVWYFLLLVVAGLLVWMCVKGVSTWFGASRRRDAKTAAAIAVPVLIVGGGINYEFHRGCTDSYSLHESSNWEQITAFDLPPG